MFVHNTSLSSVKQKKPAHPNKRKAKSVKSNKYVECLYNEHTVCNISVSMTSFLGIGAERRLSHTFRTILLLTVGSDISFSLGAHSIAYNILIT